jgi:hypothetical protein
VLLSNTGADAKGWWWYYGLSAADLGDRLSQNGAKAEPLREPIRSALSTWGPCF